MPEPGEVKLKVEMYVEDIERAAKALYQRQEEFSKCHDPYFQKEAEALGRLAKELADKAARCRQIDWWRDKMEECAWDEQHEYDDEDEGGDDMDE